MLKSFDDKERINIEHAKNHCNAYTFYDKIGLKEMSIIRSSELSTVWRN